MQATGRIITDTMYLAKITFCTLLPRLIDVLVSGVEEFEYDNERSVARKLFSDNKFEGGGVQPFTTGLTENLA